MKRSSLTKNIYHNGRKYYVGKTIKGKAIRSRQFDTLDEAIRCRDWMKANNWQQLPLTPEEIEKQERKEYFKNIHLSSYGTHYVIFHNERYYGNVKTIEEALYYRDLVVKQGIGKKPKELDLKTDNPYLNGLKFEVPERLIKPERKSEYGKGTISQQGPGSFRLYYGDGRGGRNYICSVRTYEMAYYVREEMRKVNWDKSQLQRILDEYPKWYTELLYFYQYILKTDRSDRWYVAPPKEYTDGHLEHILYSNLEDALFERDFLKEHNWDYSLLAETIDDSDNPYYDMELPPYPMRKIRNIRDRDYHEIELTKACHMIWRDNSIRQEAVAEALDVTMATLRNWLKRYWNTSWQEFKRIAVAGDNPIEVLEKAELIYQPDLSRTMPSNFNNYVSRKEDQYGLTWVVSRRGVYYGAYKTEATAQKVSKELAKVDWDKSKLEAIREKLNCKSVVMSKRWVYPNGKGWSVRRKNKERKMINYGTWQDKRIAEIARDMYIKYGFDPANKEWVNDIAEWTVHILDLLPLSMFGKMTFEDIAYLEADYAVPYTRPASDSDKLTVSRYINGKYVYYGQYDKDKAREVVEFLEDNNWDKELLKTMQEMGEI